ncbi:hypothetical protein [Vibrio splendidus]|uniref:hypothetical protein n=1 Tax=Vibrio splendidus TaxID=29497 RepID=UPI000C84745C|nr:hypothetical protein [Vibrio splendidus]PMG51301.1 hypothetical protein BCU89_23180 [Vibrio splendidus]
MPFDNFLNNAKSNSKGSRALKRVYDGILFFIALSSITSLSDLIFHWKGFIADGLSLYQSYFVKPIQSIAENVGLSYSEPQIHSAIILSTTVGIGMKLLSDGQLEAFAKINEQYGSNLKPNLLYFKLVSFIFPLILWVSYGLSDVTIYLVPHVLLALVYPFVLTGTKEVLVKLEKSDDGYREKSSFNYTRNYYCYLALIALFIGFLGAVNSGLTRVV